MERTARRGLLVLDATFLAISISLVLLVPGGGWKNISMRVPLWWNGDPGVGYLVGSLYVFTPDRHTFVGHPGLPIEIIVGVLPDSFTPSTNSAEATNPSITSGPEICAACSSWAA